MENGDGGEAAGETKMAAAGLTNGHVNADPAAASAAGGTEVVTRSKPQVTESFRSAENIGENSSDVERFKSKVTEFSDTGNHSVANEKQYEENALKAMREKTDDSEMTSTTETRLAQRNRVETTDTGATKSHYSENQDKKHETTSQSTERVGDMTAKKATSESSHQKSAVSVDATSDGGHAVLVDIGNDTSSKTTEEIQGDNFRGTRKVETSKSERKMEYTSHSGGSNGVGGGGGGRSQLDLGTQFDELFGAKGEQVKRDKRNVSFLDDYEGGRDRMGAMREYPEDLEFLNHAPGRRPGGGYGGVQVLEAEEDDYLDAGYSSSRKVRGGMQDYREEADVYQKAPSWGLSTDRRTADDLVQRILSESRSGPSTGSRPGRRAFDDDRPYSPSAKPYSPSTMPYSPKYPARTRGEEDGPYSPSPSPSAMKKDKIFKVDMGDGGMASQRFAEGDGIDLSGGPEVDNGLQLQEMPMSKRKPQRQTEEMSLLDRRLASMGFDTKLGQQMYVKKDSGNNEGYVETTYISKKKPPGTFLGQQDDDLDDEINAMRSSFQDNLTRRSRILQDDYEDDESQSSAGGHSAGGGGGGAGYRSRGKMVRQQYVEDADSFGYRPRPGTPPEDYIPDDEFVPKKRPETEEVVKEKTASIRTVIDKQSGVLEKLREASSSFDDLSNEIRSIKQQFMENQMKRTYIMQDEPEGPDGDPERSHGFDRADYLGGNYVGVVRGAPEEDGYRPYIPRKQRMEMQRSRSMYDDVYSGPPRGGGGADDMEEYEPYPRRDPMTFTEGPPQRHYEPMEDDDDALGYGAQPARRSYESSTTNNYTSSATAARYLNRPAFNRSNTVSDFNFDRPSSPASYVRHDRYDRPSTFSSRFLDKVRDKRTTGSMGSSAAAMEADKRDRPFKSRFLKDSFTGSSTSSYSSSSKSSYSARSSTTARTEVASGGAGASVEATISSNDAATPAAEPAPTESTPAAE